MAATAVYARLAHISRGDGKVTLDPPFGFSNISSTTAAFSLSGGKYQLAVIGSTFGTVTLQVLGPDGTTYLTAATAFAANGAVAVDLAAGTYKLALA